MAGYITTGMTGKKHSEETKAKIRASMKRREELIQKAKELQNLVSETGSLPVYSNDEQESSSKDP